MAIRLLAFALLVLMTVSCNSGREENSKISLPGKKEMVELNRYFVQKDRERVESYIERKGLKMTETSSGFWYSIVKEGNGSYLTDNDRIMMEYDCSLLDGTICYSSKDLGLKEIMLGKSKIESGLDQGLRMMKPGGEAIFLIPPFLAYGLTGDGKKIPAKAVIIYEVKILNKE
jgi:FKBP-type peptidyl-prolyl cis-trans isomerase FkpA